MIQPGNRFCCTLCASALQTLSQARAANSFRHGEASRLRTAAYTQAIFLSPVAAVLHRNSGTAPTAAAMAIPVSLKPGRQVPTSTGGISSASPLSTKHQPPVFHRGMSRHRARCPRHPCVILARRDYQNLTSGSATTHLANSAPCASMGKA